jgi:cobalt-zinc-cadmium efflux system outer membrane protein
LLLAQQREVVLRESVGLYRATLDAAEKRLRAGDVSPTDVARVSVDALRAENDMRQSRGDVLKAQATLAYMIGMEAESSRIRASDPWPPISSLAPMPDLETLLESRPDVKAARARSYMAEKTRDLARAQRSRDVTVGVQYEHFPPDNRNMLGVGISMPIFANYEYAGEIRRAEVDRMAAEDNLERVIALARTDSTRTRADVESASDRVRRYHGTILDQARKAAAAAEFAYRHGALGVMDLLDARRTLKATLLDAATAEAEYAKALVAWESAITVNAKEEK